MIHMPIKIPYNLPAYSVLNKENIFVMEDSVAEHQDIRPLKVAILNLMPKKIDTETQILRLLSNTPLQVDIELVQMASHKSKTTPQEHLIKFYKTFEEVKDERFDGMIITGAPVEKLAYEDVDYWPELCEIMKWTTTNVFMTMHICWGAMAGLYYHYGIPKYDLDSKMFGVFEHKCLVPQHPLLKGFDDTFMVPQSRYTELKRSDIEKTSMLSLLTYSEQSGVHIVADKLGRQLFITGHGEYDRMTLAAEYFRDVDKGLDIQVPCNYFPDDNPALEPYNSWNGHANLMFSNWLNYCVYQKTPFDLKNL